MACARPQSKQENCMVLWTEVLEVRRGSDIEETNLRIIRRN